VLLDRLRLAREDRSQARLRDDRRLLRLGKLELTRVADPHAGVQDLETVRALLRRRLAVARVFSLTVIVSTGPKYSTLPAKSSTERVLLRRVKSKAAADHLDVEARRLRRAEQRDRIDRGSSYPVVSTSIDVSARSFPSLKSRSRAARVSASSVPCTGAAAMPARTSATATCSACCTPAQKTSHFLPRREETHHLLDDRVGDVLQVDRALERAGDELPAARGDAGRVESADRGLGDQRAEEALLDQIADRDVVRDIGEERILPPMEESGVEPVRRRGEPDEPHVRVLGAQRLDHLPVARVVAERHEVRFIDEHDVERAELVRIRRDGLDPGDDDRRVRVASS
jgi:hypothetical protein